MKNELTILTCNFNTAELVVNLLRSAKLKFAEMPNVVVMNTSTDLNETNLLAQHNIPHYNFVGGIHGEAVNLGFKKIQTKYVLLVDSDLIFLKDIKEMFQIFKDNNLSLMGKIVGDVGEKKLYPRVEPWYCFIDLEELKKHKIQFFDREKTKASKNSSRVYDIGSTMYEDILARSQKEIGDAPFLEKRYFKHYGGMSWRTQKFNNKDVDTDIDFGGTHPHQILFDIGMQVKQEYLRETECLKDITISDLFTDA